MKTDKTNGMLVVMPLILGKDVAPKTNSLSQEHRDKQNAGKRVSMSTYVYLGISACWQHHKARE